MICNDPELKELNRKLKVCFGYSLNQVVSDGFYVYELRRLAFYWLFQFTNKTTVQIAAQCARSNALVTRDVHSARLWAKTKKEFIMKIEWLKRA